MNKPIKKSLKNLNKLCIHKNYTIALKLRNEIQNKTSENTFECRIQISIWLKRSTHKQANSHSTTNSQQATYTHTHTHTHSNSITTNNRYCTILTLTNQPSYSCPQEEQPVIHLNCHTHTATHTHALNQVIKYHPTKMIEQIKSHHKNLYINSTKLDKKHRSTIKKRKEKKHSLTKASHQS